LLHQTYNLQIAVLIKVCIKYSFLFIPWYTDGVWPVIETPIVSVFRAITMHIKPEVKNILLQA